MPVDWTKFVYILVSMRYMYALLFPFLFLFTPPSNTYSFTLTYDTRPLIHSYSLTLAPINFAIRPHLNSHSSSLVVIPTFAITLIHTNAHPPSRKESRVQVTSRRPTSSPPLPPLCPLPSRPHCRSVTSSVMEAVGER